MATYRSVQPTWFALEGQNSLDPRLFIAKMSISVHQSDVISWFSYLGRREEAAQADDGTIFIWSREARSLNCAGHVHCNKAIRHPLQRYTFIFLPVDKHEWWINVEERGPEGWNHPWQFYVKVIHFLYHHHWIFWAEKKIWNSLIPSVFRNLHPCGDSYRRHRWRNSLGSQQHLLSGWSCDRHSGRTVSPDLEI